MILGYFFRIVSNDEQNPQSKKGPMNFWQGVSAKKAKREVSKYERYKPPKPL
jgi:hypothetical protein